MGKTRPTSNNRNDLKPQTLPDSDQLIPAVNRQSLLGPFYISGCSFMNVRLATEPQKNPPKEKLLFPTPIREGRAGAPSPGTKAENTGKESRVSSLHSRKQGEENQSEQGVCSIPPQNTSNSSLEKNMCLVLTTSSCL